MEVRMRWVCIDQVRASMCEYFSQTTVTRVIMTLRLNSHGSDFIELTSIRGLLHEDIGKTQIDRVIMALTTAPVPATA